MLLFNLLLLFIFSASHSRCLELTGNLDNDFFGGGLVVQKVLDAGGAPDVGTPAALNAAGLALSGWDIAYVAFHYDAEADELFVGVACFAVCGDADGDGAEGGTSAALDGAGGLDWPALAFSESALVAFDFDADGAYEYVLGVPAGRAVDSQPLPCSALIDNSCFGLYEYSGGSAVSQPQYRFRYAGASSVLGELPSTYARNHNTAPSTAAPDLEWSIVGFDAFMQRAGYASVKPRTFTFRFLAYAGSFDDDGVGEDLVADTVTVPCSTVDVCGVCNGQGTTCLDCAGIPNGSAEYDYCMVCNGDSSTCVTPEPTTAPSMSPSLAPSFTPTLPPTHSPTLAPTPSPTLPTMPPTPQPTPQPTPVPPPSAINFTGDVGLDFGFGYKPLRWPAVRVFDGDGPDIGYPGPISHLAPTGKDLKYAAFQYDYDADTFNIGISCYGICGDIDGDGDPSRTSAEFDGLGGVDMPFFASSESIVVVFDFNMDNQPEFLVGYPSAFAFDSDPVPAQQNHADINLGWCSEAILDASCFGLYRYSGSSLNYAYASFKWIDNDEVLGDTPASNAIDHNPILSAMRPDIEWTIKGFSNFRSKAGFTTVSPFISWSFKYAVISFSWDDDGLGDDWMPGGWGTIATLTFPCYIKDRCGVCGGDGSSCADCLGVPYGDAFYDVCGVCNGDSSTCRRITFTGDAALDFGASNGLDVLRVIDADEGFEEAQVLPDGSLGPPHDVGVPEALCEHVSPVEFNCPVSGLDIRQIFFAYDDITDVLLIGIDCFGICGDVDGDGFEGLEEHPVFIKPLWALGGLDNSLLSGTEGIALALDLNLDVADVYPTYNPDALVPFDIIIGVPSGQPAGVSSDTNDPNRLECSRNIGIDDRTYLNMQDCFGVYVYQNTRQVNLARRFLRRLEKDQKPWPTINFNAAPTISKPDFEWEIQYFSEIRKRFGTPFIRSRKEPWTMLMQAFFGSFDDDGIGEDFIPSPNDYAIISFPCKEMDLCDVCLGDSSSCLDCAHIPNGPNLLDECGKCGGDSTTCTLPTSTPSLNPSVAPSFAPTPLPPTNPPTFPPTSASETGNPTQNPLLSPSTSPTTMPTTLPTFRPATQIPTFYPSAPPTIMPTTLPTLQPAAAVPSILPTLVPSRPPTVEPFVTDTNVDTQLPTFAPSRAPMLYNDSVLKSSSAPQLSESMNDANPSVGTIAGVIVGVIACILLFTLLLCLFLRHRKREKQNIFALSNASSAHGTELGTLRRRSGSTSHVTRRTRTRMYGARPSTSSSSGGSAGVARSRMGLSSVSPSSSDSGNLSRAQRSPRGHSAVRMRSIQRLASPRFEDPNEPGKRSKRGSVKKQRRGERRADYVDVEPSNNNNEIYLTREELERRLLPLKPEDRSFVSASDMSVDQSSFAYTYGGFEVPSSSKSSKVISSASGGTSKETKYSTLPVRFVSIAGVRIALRTDEGLENDEESVEDWSFDSTEKSGAVGVQPRAAASSKGVYQSCSLTQNAYGQLEVVFGPSPHTVLPSNALTAPSASTLFRSFMSGKHDEVLMWLADSRCSEATRLAFQALMIEHNADGGAVSYASSMRSVKVGEHLISLPIENVLSNNTSDAATKSTEDDNDNEYGRSPGGVGVYSK